MVKITVMTILFGICTVGALVYAILLWNESRKPQKGGTR